MLLVIARVVVDVVDINGGGGDVVFIVFLSHVVVGGGRDVILDDVRFLLMS